MIKYIFPHFKYKITKNKDFSKNPYFYNLGIASKDYQ
jgi:hypothetical protein